MIEKIKIQLDKRIGDITTISNAWQDYFQVRYDKQGHFVSYQERKEAIQRELKLCGYFCIITSEKMTASEALIHYKGRDVSEKLFRTDKTFIGSKSMRYKVHRLCQQDICRVYRTYRPQQDLQSSERNDAAVGDKTELHDCPCSPQGAGED